LYINHLGRLNPHLNTRWLQQHDNPHYTSTVSDLLATQLATILYCHAATRTTEGIVLRRHEWLILTSNLTFSALSVKYVVYMFQLLLLRTKKNENLTYKLIA